MKSKWLGTTKSVMQRKQPRRLVSVSPRRGDSEGRAKAFCIALLLGTFLCTAGCKSNPDEPYRPNPYEGIDE